MQFFKVMAVTFVISLLTLAGCGGGGGGVGGGSTADTVSPTVSITAVADSASAGVRTVSVNAADNVGVTRVELLADGVPIGTDTAGPYSFSWDISAFSKGSIHTLSAKAYDTAGNVGSANVVVTVPITALMNTVVSGNSAVGTVVLSGLPTPQAFGLNMTVTMPNGASMVGGTPTGVAAAASAIFLPVNATTFGLGGTSGFGSGEVMKINFSNVPAGAKAGDFSISLLSVLDSVFNPIQ
jgi:hypothetical protein